MGGDIASQLRVIATKKETPSTVIKNFQIFVSKKHDEIAKDVASILEKFVPTTNVEKLLKVKLVDQFRVSSEIIKLLQSSDSLYVNQALKCTWYFTDLQDPDGFVREVIPTLSLSTRLKIINKYATHLKSCKSGEILYVNLKSRYGTRLALTLLPVCGENFIRNELPNVKITLPANVALILLDKYPSLTIEYLKYLADSESSKSRRQNLLTYERVLVKLSNKDLKSFIDLYEKFPDNIPYLHLGRRATKKLIKNEPDKVVNNYESYQRILVERTFFPRLPLAHFKTLYLRHILPEGLSNFLQNSRKTRTVLQYLKPEVRSSFLLTEFFSKYGRELTSDEILFNLEDYWIDYIPQDAKTKWIEKKVLEYVNEPVTAASYIAQLPVDVSIPKLQKLIESQSDAKVRISVAQSLVETVRYNKSAKSIKSLIEYFTKRFRNEVSEFLTRVASNMAGLGDLYLELDADDWVPMMQFCNILKLNDIELYSVFIILSYRLRWAILKNADVESCFGECWDFFEKNRSSAASFCQGTPVYGRCLTMTSLKAEKAKWKSDSSKWSFAETLLSCICEFNRYHAKERIDIPNWIVTYIDRQMNVKPDKVPVILSDMIRCLMWLPDKNLWVTHWKKLMSSNHSVHVDDKTLCILLDKDPEFTLRKIGSILKKEVIPVSNFNSFVEFYKKCRLYDSYGIASEITKTCSEFVNSPDDTGARPHAIRVLALLLPGADYIKLASKYVPTSDKIEEFSDEVKQLYDAQRAICKSFVDVSVPVDTLSLLRKFTVGDYLKLVVGSLTGICVKVPETQILSLLKDSMDCPVSLRKHILRMITQIAPVELKINTIIEVFKTERNVSLRLVLFQQIQKTFFDEPEDESFSTLTSIVSQLTKDDEEALKKLLDLTCVDDIFISPYLELIWKLIDSKWAEAMPNGKTQIIELMDSHFLKILSEEFCHNLLQFELSTKLPNQSPARFVSLYLMHSPSLDVQARRLNKVMAEFKNLIASSWNDYSFGPGRVFAVRYVVYDLIDKICELSCSGDAFRINPVHVLNELKKHVSEIKPENSLVERLRVDLAIAYQSHYPGDTGYLSSVAELYKSYSQIYGNLMETQLVDTLVKYAPSDKRNQLAQELVNDSDPICQVVGVNLLSVNINQDADVPIYKSAIGNLLESSNPKVQAAAHVFFISLTSSII